MTFTVGSLFSGIGGLDLGLERAGMKVIWQSEIDPYATRVLTKHWPEVPNHGDIKRIDWRNIVRPDVICGGYPCQPFSLAGARKGEEDPRHLWPWVRHAISVLRPRYAILENVRGHLSLGGSTVLREIAAIGYCAEWRVISAASVGANHRRDRVFIVAYTDDARSRAPRRDDQPEGPTSLEGREELAQSGLGRCSKALANTDGGHPTDGRQRTPISSKDRSRRNDGGRSDTDLREITVRGSGQNPGDLEDADSRRLQECQSETEPTRLISGTSERSREVFAGDIGNWRSWEWWETEPDVGRVAHGIPSRVDRLRGLGNAVVPQVAEIVGRLVVDHYERTTA